MSSRGPFLPTIAVIGLGNWGTSLAHGLRASAIPPDEVIRTSGSTRPGARARGLPLVNWGQARFEAKIFWLCVPDSAIESVVHRLVGKMETQSGSSRRPPLSGRIVVHSSGALSSTILKGASDAGASVASVHPLMTFPSRIPVSLSGTPFGVEASGRTRSTLHAIVRRLGGRPFDLDDSAKALYHAATVMASPLLVSLLAATEQAAALAGLRPRQARLLLEPIAQATVKNVFARGANNSFSGPIARGDGAVIRLHLQALARHPMLAGVYRALALYALDALPARKRAELRHILRHPASGGAR